MELLSPSPLFCTIFGSSCCCIRTLGNWSIQASSTKTTHHYGRVHVTFFQWVTSIIQFQSGLSLGFCLYLQQWKVGPSGFDQLQWLLMFPCSIVVSNENVFFHELDLLTIFDQGSAGFRLPIKSSSTRKLEPLTEFRRTSQQECWGVSESPVQVCRFWAAHHSRQSVKSPAKTDVLSIRPLLADASLQVLNPEYSADNVLFSLGLGPDRSGKPCYESLVFFRILYSSNFCSFIISLL